VTTTPRPPHQAGQPSQSRLRRYVAGLAATGLLSTPLLLATTGSAVADQETPAERCQRQTAEYNAAMDAAWRAAHPGQEPTGNEWPPFVCHDIPTPTLPPGPPPSGGDGGDGAGGAGDPAPGRTHHYQGFDRPEGQYRQDMDLGGLGSPRTGLAERMGAGGPGAATDTTRPSAGDTARSNVPRVVPWETTVTDDNGDSRQVRVVDTPDGPAVVTDDGTATGEVLTTDTDSGVTSTTRRDGLAGRQLTDPDTARAESTDDTDTSPTSEAAPAGTSGDHAANGGNGSNGTGGDGDQGGSGGDLPVGPLGAGGLLAGAAGAILADRRRRDGTHRGDINWGNGREQSLILLEGPDSPREHRFDMDVPDGGQMVKNPDGSVDVLDADGNVVEHVKAPWAFDALGRPVETHFEVDNETGELVQIVDPDRTSVLPILADPDKQKSEPLKPSDPGFVGPVLAEDAQAQKEAREAAGYVPTPGEAQDPRFPDGPPEPDPEQQRRDNNNLSIAANSNQNPADVPQTPTPAPAPQPAPYTPEQIEDNNALAAAANSNQNPADIDNASGASGADATRNAPPVGAGVSTPKDPDPDGRTGGTANQAPLTEAPSEYGHHVTKNPDGAYDIDPLGLDEGSQVTRFDDGSAQIEEDNGNITRYIPAPEDGGEGGGNFAESIHYDAATDQTTQVMIQNGQRTEVTKPGRPDSAAPEGSPEASGALGTIPTNPQGVFVDPNTPRADPAIAGQAVRDVGPINPADPPSVVNHPGQNSADVSPGDGQQSVRVNPQTGEQIGLGTTDNPKEGPFVPRTFDWVPDTINNAPAVDEPSGTGEVLPDNSIPEGIVTGLGGAGQGLETNQHHQENYGRHAKPHVPSRAEDLIQRGGRVAGPVGIAQAGYNIVSADDPVEQATREGISTGFSTVGAASFGFVGGAVAGPPGAIALGALGGIAGDWFGDTVGNWLIGEGD
jgi:hypothetical protein